MRLMLVGGARRSPAEPAATPFRSAPDKRLGLMIWRAVCRIGLSAQTSSQNPQKRVHRSPAGARDSVDCYANAAAHRSRDLCAA
jgi:hypothetical protein